MGLFGMPATLKDMQASDPFGGTMQAMAQTVANAPVKAKKPGFNEPGGWAEKLAMIGASLGGSQIPLQVIMQRHQQARMAQQAEQQRAAEWDDWQRKFDYERANPKPANNDTISDYNFIAQQIGPEAANQYLRNMGDPMVNIPLSDGRFYSGPRSGMGSALGANSAPMKPVGKLTPIGGPSQSATGGFRPGY